MGVGGDMYKRHEKPEGILIAILLMVILVISQASTGFLLRDLTSSYHSKESILLAIDPFYWQLKINPLCWC